MSVSVDAEVTPQQRAHFEEQGYLVFDPEITDSVLDAVVADMDGRYGVDLSRFQSVRVQDAWKQSDAACALATAPKVLEVLRGLYGCEPRPFQTLNFPYGTEQKAHSDTIHFNSMPPGYMCGVWVALEDIDRRNGPLVFYPGSHKLPEYTMADVGVPAGWEHYDAYEEFIQDVIRQSGLSPRYATLKKGQALVWASNLLHGGAHQRDKTRTRHSQVTHYYFEGCRYYTPMLTQFAMRSPQWIVPRESAECQVVAARVPAAQKRSGWLPWRRSV